jgi:hypothetical protein
MIMWVGQAECMSEVRYAYKMLVGKSEGKRQLRKFRKLRSRCEDNTKNLSEIDISCTRETVPCS